MQNLSLENSLSEFGRHDKDRKYSCLQEYFDLLFKDKPASYNMTAPMLASMCRTLLLTPDEVYGWLIDYCEANQIELKTGGENE